MRLVASAVIAAVLACFGGTASAQFENAVYYNPVDFQPTSTNVRPADTLVATFTTGPCVPAGPAGCITGFLFVPLTSFAATNSGGQTQGLINAFNAQIN